MGTPVSDQEAITQLSLELEGLRISITRSRQASGPAPLPVDPVSSVPCHEVPRASTASQGYGLDSAGSSDRLPNPPTLSSQTLPESRAAIEASFPPLPLHLLDTARSLRSTVSSPQERAKRAWVAGCWASAVLNGRSTTPNATPQLQLPSRVYVVIQTPFCSHVQVTSSRSTYLRLVDNHRGLSLSHGWPTETEARIYVAGAGRTYPSSQTQ